MSWAVYVFIFIPVTLSTFHIPEIRQIDAQTLHIAAICVTVDLMVIVFTQCVSICVICRHTEFILPVSTGFLAAAIILKSKQGLQMDTVVLHFGWILY